MTSKEVNKQSEATRSLELLNDLLIIFDLDGHIVHLLLTMPVLFSQSTQLGFALLELCLDTPQILQFFFLPLVLQLQLTDPQLQLLHFPVALLLNFLLVSVDDTLYPRTAINLLTRKHLILLRLFILILQNSTEFTFQLLLPNVLVFL